MKKKIIAGLLSVSMLFGAAEVIPNDILFKLGTDITASAATSGDGTTRPSPTGPSRSQATRALPQASLSPTSWTARAFLQSAIRLSTRARSKQSASPIV